MNVRRSAIAFVAIALLASAAVLTDAFSADVLHGTVPPYFRAGDYAGGLNAAIDQIAKKIDPNFVSTTTMPAPRPRPARSSNGGGADMFFPSIFFLFVIL